jgi:hypothetical protein
MNPLLFDPGQTAAGAAYALGLAATLFLIAVLVQRELIDGLGGKRAQRLSRALTVATLPLLGLFALVVIDRVTGLLAR